MQMIVEQDTWKEHQGYEWRLVLGGGSMLRLQRRERFPDLKHGMNFGPKVLQVFARSPEAYQWCVKHGLTY
jgi:hypothetical protein